MSMDAIINLEEALGRKFTEQESARLREIGRQLHLRDDDAGVPKNFLRSPAGQDC